MRSPVQSTPFLNRNARCGTGDAWWRSWTASAARPEPSSLLRDWTRALAGVQIGARGGGSLEQLRIRLFAVRASAGPSARAAARRVGTRAADPAQGSYRLADADAGPD